MAEPAVLLRAALVFVHVGAAAVWLGAMVYSLAVVQPRAQRFFRDVEAYEQFAVELAAGARRPVLGLCAVLALSGAGLIAVARASADRSPLWMALVLAKAVLLLVALALFSYVTWQLWPARLFAQAGEVASYQRRFRVVGALLASLVAAQFVLGGLAVAVP